jgi:hypothetical protein
MLHFADCSAVARAELAQDYEVLGLEVEAELDADLEGVVLVVFALPRITGSGSGLWWGCAESKTLLVLPLHRLGGEG